MYDKVLFIEIMKQIHYAGETVIKRFQPVKKVQDFTDSESGMEKLDSICMLLIAIGEALKNLDKVTEKALLPRYPQVDWKKAKGMRDIISYHYFEMDADVIFDVCANRIPELVAAVHLMIMDQSFPTKGETHADTQ
ncbi:HepT-like ribonuclease domain-containing protein [Desulfobotulus mexicanus]|uniref:DUF86 domain-containing protein n=1 Tax=Desulfobotulus mexicanus TaxID=2586642 RepID=A0A5S5MCP2_9BACT|nr:DUF86 domain-containing protein [Desulfobotulus mexicanus]TYT73450.1 DUF86 domain-containing protein [Desulfobotulus mexicanus]